MNYDCPKSIECVMCSNYDDRTRGCAAGLFKAPPIPDNLNESANPLRKHYAALKIEPFEYSMANNLDAMQHTIVKYVTRFRDKGGIRDLQAAKLTIDKLIEWEEKKDAQSKSN